MTNWLNMIRIFPIILSSKYIFSIILKCVLCRNIQGSGNIWYFRLTDSDEFLKVECRMSHKVLWILPASYHNDGSYQWSWRNDHHVGNARTDVMCPTPNFQSFVILSFIDIRSYKYWQSQSITHYLVIKRFQEANQRPPPNQKCP